ncbi:SDR family oxidoreductase [SAR202 cluster bacterium AD-802-F09_MRT_200m]|nr:SDR family oxidoreductase [SAR202 cluster bacterium AD-802-F09_MRT_200m]
MRSISKLLSLSGRSALVAGGAGHIGLAVGEALVELGATVAVLDLDIEACRERAATLSQIRDNGALAVQCDLTDEAATRSAVRKTVQELDGLDILVHCAAYVGTTQIPGWAVPFSEQTVEAWDTALRVNLTSAFIMVQEARESLSVSGHGSVILFGSTYGVVGPDYSLYEGTSMSNPAGYGASKGGILQLTRYLATTLAPRVRINTISPGGVWRGQPESFHQRYMDRTPLARMATEEDLKGAITYLAGDLSEYVTGHNLAVDGGWTAW